MTDDADGLAGSFNASNTRRQCGGCPALAANEWLALAGSFRYDAKTRRATFRSSTRIKKSTINSSLQPPSDVLAVESGPVLESGPLLRTRHHRPQHKRPGP